MFDPDEYELNEAHKYARKMARERDEARVIADRLTAELDKCAAALPGAYYMDQPDGGDVSVSEQLKRMAKDAERYRLLRRKFAIISDGEGHAEIRRRGIPMTARDEYRRGYGDALEIIAAIIDDARAKETTT